MMEAARTSETLVNFYQTFRRYNPEDSHLRTDRSRAEKLWLVCGVMGDVMLCDRERDIHPSQKFYATIHSEKMTFLTIVLFCKRSFPAVVCFRDEQ
jgi:hypothetical protein